MRKPASFAQPKPKPDPRSASCLVTNKFTPKFVTLVFAMSSPSTAAVQLPARRRRRVLFEIDQPTDVDLFRWSDLRGAIWEVSAATGCSMVLVTAIVGRHTGVVLAISVGHCLLLVLLGNLRAYTR